jgi:hypothetical protein
MLVIVQSKRLIIVVMVMPCGYLMQFFVSMV